MRIKNYKNKCLRIKNKCLSIKNKSKNKSMTLATELSRKLRSHKVPGISFPHFFFLVCLTYFSLSPFRGSLFILAALGESLYRFGGGVKNPDVNGTGTMCVHSDPTGCWYVLKVSWPFSLGWYNLYVSEGEEGELIIAIGSSIQFILVCILYLIKKFSVIQKAGDFVQFLYLFVALAFRAYQWWQHKAENNQYNYHLVLSGS